MSIETAMVACLLFAPGSRSSLRSYSSGIALIDELKLIGAREAARILGVNANTVYKLWNKGLLDYGRIHMTLKTNLKAIGEFLARTKNTDLGEL